MRIVFELGDRDERRFRENLKTALVALVRIDVAYLLSHPDTPRLYDSGVRYAPDPTEWTGGEDELPERRRVELWRDVPSVIEAGEGDCEDLACWLTAERIVRDRILARPVFLWAHKGPQRRMTYHIQVTSHERGTEDPSRRLGLPQHRFA